MNTMTNTTDCKTCKSHLADLLVDNSREGGYAAAHPELSAHLAECTECRTELAELVATFALLDQWTAPDPSPYFDAKVRVRLREAAAAPPEGFWERTRVFLQFSTGRHLRPAMTGALAVLMLVGGGAGIGIYEHNNAVVAVSPAVNDLKILDNNAQAIQQMDQLLDESAPSADDNAAPPTT
jgi:anti-sigma factor RsiW